ncbi:winged helix-turn-helix domain-containing protein [Streptomyces sp. NPDC003737]|uniref:winged helix-turn-helix domain-containing protein n=1 Tax=Streptomyces sp. NPDC003737 TaxID=3364685 RepID=UPI0036B13D7D
MNDSNGLSAQEVADILRERINGGEFTESGRLPSQSRLAEELGVSRQIVRKAQNKLRDAGFLGRPGKGSPPRIAEQATSNEMPQPTLVGLAPRLKAAFQRPNVYIDAVCLTAETLMNSMYVPLSLVASGDVKPSSVTARIILPAREHQLLYPAPLEEWGEDQRIDVAVHKRSEKQHVAQVNVLWRHFTTLSDYGVNATVRFRVVKNTPYQKFYLLNKDEALIAHYKISQREEEIDGLKTTLRDTSGTQSLLFPFDRYQGERDARFVEDTQTWFDAFWDSLKTDLRVPLVTS